MFHNMGLGSNGIGGDGLGPGKGTAWLTAMETSIPLRWPIIPPPVPW